MPHRLRDLCGAECVALEVLEDFKESLGLAHRVVPEIVSDNRPKDAKGS